MPQFAKLRNGVGGRIKCGEVHLAFGAGRESKCVEQSQGQGGSAVSDSPAR